MSNSEKSWYKTGKTIIKLFILILFISISATVHADKIRIILHQPPPNQMGVGDLWNLTLENTTQNDIKIYLTGTVTEDKDGIILEGKSKVFTIKPGKTNYKYNDFAGAEIKYNNGKYKEVILRTGNAPEGSYSVCISAFSEEGEVVGIENCITQQVQQMGSITLISPEDKAEIDPDTLPGLVFSWTPLPKGGPYTLRIVELKGDQSPDEAFKSNQPIFEKDDIRATTHHVAPSQVKVIMMGMKYAWQISAGNVTSNINSFSMMQSQYQIIIDTVIMRCDSIVPNKYSYQVKVKNNNPAGSPYPTITAKTFITGVTPAYSSITPALLTPYSVNYPNSVTISGTITFLSPTTSAQFVVKMEDNSQPATYNATAPYTVSMPFCCVPITTLPPMVGWWTFDETSGTTFFDRAGFNNEGSQVNTLGFITGKVAGALDFTNGYVSVQTHADMNVFVCDSLSIDAWIKTTGNSTYAIVEKREMTSCGQPVGYSFFLQNGKLGFQTSNGVTFSNFVTPALTPAINNGNWQHVAVTMNRNPANSTIKFYRDGVLVQTSTTTGLVGGLQNGSPLLIGCITPGMVFGGTTFPGGIDEVEIFKRVLTQPQINSIFSAQGFGKCKQ